jgi:hypothetical protein
LAATAQTFQEVILPAAAGRKQKPTGHNGVKHPSMFCIPAHLWVSPILHNELGLVKDWLTRVERFCDCHIETLSEVENDSREHLIILGELLEESLIEQDELTPKETIKEYESHFKAINNEIRKRDVRIPHQTTGVLISTVPGRVTPQEQQLLAQLTWEIDSRKQQSAELQKEIKTTK